MRSTDSALHAARDAARKGDSRPLDRLLAAELPGLVALSRWHLRRHGVYNPSEHDVDDGASRALEAAWKAIVGYRWCCSRCRRASKRWGTVSAYSAESVEAYEVHGQIAHGVIGLAPQPTIRARAYYLAGVAAAGWARQVRRRLNRTGDSAMLDRAVDLAAAQALAVIEAKLDEMRGDAEQDRSAAIIGMNEQEEERS